MNEDEVENYLHKNAYGSTFQNELEVAVKNMRMVKNKYKREDRKKIANRIIEILQDYYNY